MTREFVNITGYMDFFFMAENIKIGLIDALLYACYQTRDCCFKRRASQRERFREESMAGKTKTSPTAQLKRNAD
jgi:hypothetical protein